MNVKIILIYLIIIYFNDSFIVGGLMKEIEFSPEELDLVLGGVNNPDISSAKLEELYSLKDKQQKFDEQSADEFSLEELDLVLAGVNNQDISSAKLEELYRLREQHKIKENTSDELSLHELDQVKAGRSR